jgi:hypothetical protein
MRARENSAHHPNGVIQMKISEIPAGKVLICTSFITLKNGKKLFAHEKGLKVFCFLVDADKVRH